MHMKLEASEFTGKHTKLCLDSVESDQGWEGKGRWPQGRGPTQNFPASNFKDSKNSKFETGLLSNNHGVFVKVGG